MSRPLSGIGKAMAICQDINSDRFTDEQKATAIYLVMNMATHNSFTKEKMLEVIKWLWHYIFQWNEPEQED
ncbi:MAG: hypothetical protein K2F67_07570 [Eubacterium sp.]|nr:hypothetical protein [Eubacterium sp.]